MCSRSGAPGTQAVERSDYSALVGCAEKPPHRLRGLVTALASILSMIFVGVCWFFYWFSAIPAAITALVIPRSVLERQPLFWLSGASIGLACLTQTIDTFFPNYLNPHGLLCEVAVWFGIGFLARTYLAYTQIPDTFDGVRATISSRNIDKWFESVLPNSIDAIFTRIWVGNSIIILPLIVLLIVPSTSNYFVVLAYSALLLLSQFPYEITDHVNIHTRIFNPKPGASDATRRTLKACQVYFEKVLPLLSARVPDYYRIQHVYVHHVEENGPDDTQSTMAYDRKSFFDFARHAFWQGLELVSGFSVIPYLRRRKKDRQLREFKRGFAIWYAFVIAVTIINPIAGVLIYVSRFFGGNILTLVAFFQHGVIDPRDVHDVHGNTLDYAGPEHGSLGDDYHVEHHLKPARHWSRYHEDFKKESASESGPRALTLDKEPFTPIAFVGALWRRDFSTVARYAKIKVADGDAQSVEDLVKKRTRPIGNVERSGWTARLDGAMGSVMAWMMLTSFHSCGLSRVPSATALDKSTMFAGSLWQSLRQSRMRGAAQ
jgi:hypothetical protein